MNSITIHGKLLEDASSKLITIKGQERPLIEFNIIDRGFPYNKDEVGLTIKIVCIESYATLLLEYLKKDKEVLITGQLKQVVQIKNKKMERMSYILAEYICFVPLYNASKL